MIPVNPLMATGGGSVDLGSSAESGTGSVNVGGLHFAPAAKNANTMVLGVAAVAVLAVVLLSRKK